MKKYFICQIDWISYEEGGRKKIPSKGVRYCPLIRINGAVSYEEWSIDFICPDFKETDLIKFQFLVDDAPCELIEKNMDYNIYEGNRKVARLKIIERYDNE